MVLHNDFEGGSDETTITTGNSGGASGDAFTLVNIGSGNALKYDTAHAAHGLLSARLDLGTSSGTPDQFGWVTFANQTEVWGYAYIYLTSIFSLPTAMRLIGFVNSSSVGIGRINLGNDRTIQVDDKNFAHTANTVGVVPLNTWTRIAYRCKASATVGEIEARIYLGDNSTPITDGTVQTTAGADTGTEVAGTAFGLNANWNDPAFTFWMGDVNVNTNTDFGPPTIITTTFSVNF